MSDNPYQAPAVQEVVAPAATEVEAIRNQHLKHEASLKGAGFLYLLGAVFVALSLVGLIAVYGGMRTRSESGPGGRELAVLGLLVVVCMGQFVAGWGLRKLRPWVKIPAALLAGISMLRFPIGTLFGGYILYLLFSAKGRTILSPGYADIIAQTPHLRYRTPRWVWMVLLGLLLLFLAAFGFAWFSPLVH